MPALCAGAAPHTMTLRQTLATLPRDTRDTLFLLVVIAWVMAPQVALLTIYDMCMAVDRGMSIHDVRVVEKHGGKSGSFVAGAAG